MGAFKQANLKASQQTAQLQASLQQAQADLAAALQVPPPCYKLTCVHARDLYMHVGDYSCIIVLLTLRYLLVPTGVVP